MRPFFRCFSRLGLIIAVLGLLSAASQAQDNILNLRDADIRAFIDDVSMMTGRIFIVDPQVRGNVTVTSRDPLTPEEVFEVFLTTLRVSGYTALPTSSGAYRIIPDNTAAQSGAPVVAGETGDRFVTSVMRTRNMEAVEVLNLIRPVVSQEGRASAIRGSDTLILVDYASNMAELQALVRELDRDTSVVRQVRLTNSVASEMASVLTDLERSGADEGRPRYTAVPVDSSNTLILRGPADVLEKLIPVINELDANNASNSDIRVINLKHARAEELVPMLQQISQSLSAQGGENQARGRANIAHHPANNALIINGDPEILKTLQSVINQLDVRRAQVLVEAIIVEISDTAARELGLQFLLSGGEGSNIPFTVTNYSNTAPNILAATGALLVDREFGDADNGTLDQLRSAAVDSLLGINGFAGGAAGVTDNGTLFGFIVNALEQDISSNVLSTPSIMTMDNAEASIIVGQEIPITTGEALGSANANPFRTIERRNVGIQLEVLPQINDGDVIQLFIRQEVSSIFGPVSENFTELVTNKREIETTVSVDDGEIIVLGGLIEEDEQLSFNKVPILGDIPILGRAFRSEGRSRERTNLMVFLRPRIIRDVRDIQNATGRKYNYIRAEQMLSAGEGQSNLDSFVRDLIGAETPDEAQPNNR